mmetsp:Transcript_23349/g.34621  ORF Transcript_23349/g.34621 Transcript_23349/m.34621 type:complete len:352 (-) Transcript_23349:174-1229(-)
MTMTDQHSADAAGGEAIYSSDALPPIPIPPPPPSISKNTPVDVIDSGDGETVYGYEAAFGVFGAKANFNSNSNGTECETREDKLKRFEKELDEIGSQDEKDEALKNNISALQERLKSMSASTSSVLSSRRAGAAPGSASASASAPIQASEITLEERLLQVEKYLGASSLSLSASSVMERLQSAEDQLASVNEKTLASAASRAKVIRADLEAAAKARSKISNAGQSASDAHKISKIYSQLTDLDGFLTGSGGGSGATNVTTAATNERSEGSGSSSCSSNNNNVLSTIVNRLTACAELHSSSSEFGSDLKALEEMLTDTKVLLSGLETTVATLETGMEDNMKVIASNMENFDK